MKVAPPLTGQTSARVHGAIAVLSRRARTARLAADRLPKDHPAAAMLRGKAHAYNEAAELLRRIDYGDRLPRKRKDSDDGRGAERFLQEHTVTLYWPNGTYCPEGLAHVGLTTIQTTAEPESLTHFGAIGPVGWCSSCQTFATQPPPSAREGLS